ncbi:MAG: inositol monophosphatase [Verrucomicrobia bacterium RIFCSPHIGHO2_12_FULL_41_10]|nr:MAG: inositol monophosphatase [Verrucomicrobia bacterium RIFCSPHIGHO2_12_FULL_41_10]HLB33837.1 inositol monophosphatase family protein [Chthoniobacterales bacterium]
MNTLSHQKKLTVAREAALAAGQLLRENAIKNQQELIVDHCEAHDIKLELDRRSQTLIEKIVNYSFPDFAIYGEEGVSGDPKAEYQWVIDPIDGTVNFFYGIPHFAISIALRQAGETILGVIYDPMRNELWEAIDGGIVTMNERPIRVSTRTQLNEAVLSIGMSKTADSIEQALPRFAQMIRTVRKCRMMGSATLDMAYVASGRLDAYIESQISLWDIAAGALMVKMAGGYVDLRPHATEADKYSIIASSGRIPLDS